MIYEGPFDIPKKDPYEIIIKGHRFIFEPRKTGCNGSGEILLEWEYYLQHNPFIHESNIDFTGLDAYIMSLSSEQIELFKTDEKFMSLLKIYDRSGWLSTVMWAKLISLKLL